MTRVKIIHSSDIVSLEMQTNQFITDKRVINTSIAINPESNMFRYVCCITYERGNVR